MTSARVLASERMQPRRAEVWVMAPAARAPRMVMHRCSAWMNTATPKRIDYIVLYKGNKAACEVLGTAVPSYDEINVNKVSDHLPVLVDIKK